MSHELSRVQTGSGYAIVCIGDAWHGHQNAFTGDPQKDLAQAGLNFEAVKLPLFMELPSGARSPFDGRFGIARNDTWAGLGIVADGYNVHQVSDLYAMATEYFTAVEGWSMSSMGSLKGGKEIWFSARHENDATIGGDLHELFALMSTSFDTTQATRIQPTNIKVVCRNTLRAAWGGADCVVKRNHSAKFDSEQVAAELQNVLAGHARYKVIGDALASVQVQRQHTMDLFKQLLDIPLDAPKEKIATRTLNNYEQLWRDFMTSRDERGGDCSAFTELNAVTRYVDHSKSVQGKGLDARMSSATFGAGDRFKGQAIALLMPLIADKVAA